MEGALQNGRRERPRGLARCGVGIRFWGAAPLGTLGPPSGSTVPRSQLSALGSRQVQLQGAHAITALRCRVCPGPAVTQPPSLMGVTRRGHSSPCWERRPPLSRRGLEALHKLGPSSRPGSPTVPPGAPSWAQTVRGGCLPHPPRSVRLQRSRERQAPPQDPKRGHFRAPTSDASPEPRSRGPAGHTTSGLT